VYAIIPALNFRPTVRVYPIEEIIILNLGSLTKFEISQFYIFSLKIKFQISHQVIKEHLHQRDSNSDLSLQW